MTVEVAHRPASPPRRAGGDWRDLRNRVLSDSRFQRWASRFPLTRPIARNRARALFDLSAGFVYAQVAHACVRLRLLETLADGPKTVGALAVETGLSPSATSRLLKAATALRLAEPRSGERYGLGAQGAALLGAPGVAAMIEHHALLYADLADPVALLRRGGGGGQLSAYWSYAEGEGEALDPAQAESYSRLMAASQAMVAAQVLEAYPVARHRRLLDVGGGDGSFLRAAAEHAPALALTLFDLPVVAKRARVRFEAAGVAAEVVGGSFLHDALPGGHDLISLVRVLHDHDDGPALDLLRAIRRALPPGGRLLLAEPMAGARGAEPMGDAYFGMYLLAMGSGRPRTRGEITALLQTAGFGSVRERRTTMPLIAQVLIAGA